MSIFALISLFSFIICIILGLLIYFTQVKYVFHNDLSKIFMLLCLTLALSWAIIEFGYRQANDFSTAYSWLKLNVAWYLTISFLLHFIILYTENKKLLERKITYLIIYGPSIVFIIVDISTNLLITAPIKEAWGWTYGIPEYPLFHGLSSTWAAFSGIFCLYMAVEYYLNQKNIRKKSITKYVMFGLLIPVGIAFNTEWLFPIAGIKVPEMFVPATTICLIIIWYGIWIYGKNDYTKRYSNVRISVDRLIDKLHTSKN